MAEMTDVDLTEAHLARANLSLTLLTKVNLERADLTKAAFTYSEVKDIRLGAAQLAKSNFRGVKGLDEETKLAIAQAGGKVSKEYLKKAWRAITARRQARTAATASLHGGPPSHAWKAAIVAVLIIVAAVCATAWVGYRAAEQVGRRVYHSLMDKLRYNKGLPIATSQLERLDKDSFLYLERGFINILKWDGKDMSLVRRYRIEYDEAKNLYYLDNTMQKPSPEPPSTPPK